MPKGSLLCAKHQNVVLSGYHISSLPPDAIWNQNAYNCGSKCCSGVDRHIKKSLVLVNLQWILSDQLANLDIYAPRYFLICSSFFCAKWHLQGGHELKLDRINLVDGRLVLKGNYA